MLEFYPQIKLVHLTAVLLSGGVFALRGMTVLSGRQAWAMAAPVRYLSYVIDTVLLTAALMLVSMLPSALFANGWLAAKLVLLVLYIVLGSFALKRASRPRAKAILFVLAIATYAAMISIARAHHPWGGLHAWLG